jgi:ligand-binding SRPBCC domain-containing protein
VSEVFAFFSEAGNLDRITPGWLRFSILRQVPEEMGVGTRIEYRLRWHGLPLRWVSEIVEWSPGRSFVDEQVRGPYRLWHHAHRFETVGAGTMIEDVVRYALPLGVVGRAAHALMVRRDVERIFNYRVARIGELFAV